MKSTAHIERLMHTARRQIAVGNLAGAVESIREVLSIDPEDAEGHAILSLALVDMQRPHAAWTEALEALRFDADMALAHIAMAHAAIANQKLDIAEAEIELLLKDDPEDADVYRLAAELHGIRGGREAALSSLETARQLAPDDLDVTVDLATLLVGLGRLDEAEQLAREAIGEAPESPAAHIVMGEIRLRRGDVDSAEEHARFALLQDANNRSALYLMAEIKTRKNPLMGLWWRFNTWLGHFGDARSIAILLGMYAAYRFILAGLEDANQSAAVAALNIAWLAFVLMTWICPSIFHKSLAKELDRVELKDDY